MMLDPQNYQQKYNKLLIQYNSYRQKVITQKQSQLQQCQKYKAHIDKTYKQLQKKYESKLQQQRIQYQKKLKKIQNFSKQKQQDLNSIIESKNKFIEELKKRLIQNQQQKNQIIQSNTRMLYQLCQDMQNTEQILGPNKNTYQDLVKLYQFVLQENNNLKKQLFKVQIKSKQVFDQNKQNVNKSTMVMPTIIAKQQKKKKKTVNSSFDTSKLHYQSVKPKTSQHQVRKQHKK